MSLNVPEDDLDYINVPANDLEDIKPVEQPADDPEAFRRNWFHRIGSAAMGSMMGIDQALAHGVQAVTGNDWGDRVDAYIANENKLNAEATKDSPKLLGIGVPEAAGYLLDPFNKLAFGKLGDVVSKSPKLSTMGKTLQNVTKGIVTGYGQGLVGATEGFKYGNRPDGTPKGSGYLGEISLPNGDVATELSIGVNMDGKEVQIPSIVPTLNPEQINYIRNGGDPKDRLDIVQTAVDHAKERMLSSKSPYHDTPSLLDQRIRNANSGAIVGAALPQLRAGAGKIADVTGDVASSLFGGGVGIKEAYQAGRTSPWLMKNSPQQAEYKKYSARGTTLEDKLPDIRRIVPLIKDEANADYVKAQDEFVKLHGNRAIPEVVREVYSKANKVDARTGTYLGVDEDPLIRESKDRLHGMLRNWMDLPLDQHHTAPGLDALKMRLNSAAMNIPKGQGGSDKSISMFKTMADHVNDIINREAPDYVKMTKPYAKRMDLLDNIERSFVSEGDEAGIRKLSGALSSPYKASMLKEFDKRGIKNLPYALSGNITKKLGGANLIGSTVVSGASANPAWMAYGLALSPYISSGIANKMGKTASITSPIMSAPFKDSALPLARQLYIKANKDKKR
jgi:hypothetical protein